MEKNIKENTQKKAFYACESHAFNVEVADIYGIEEAILINHFSFV